MEPQRVMNNTSICQSWKCSALKTLTEASVLEKKGGTVGSMGQRSEYNVSSLAGFCRYDLSFTG